MQFKKISIEQWRKDLCKALNCSPYEMLNNDIQSQIDVAYNEIKLPQRATHNSAGYDFYLPVPAVFTQEETSIPTGIRWICEDSNKVLLIAPRSGLGIKHGVKLLNTIGVIDADYSHSDNEGHIFVCVKADKDIKLNAGDKFVQGIIVNYCVTNDDITKADRNGGFGSTDEVK